MTLHRYASLFLLHSYQSKRVSCTVVRYRCIRCIRHTRIVLMVTFSINVWLRFQFDSVSCSCHNCCLRPPFILYFYPISSIDVKSILLEFTYYQYCFESKQAEKKERNETVESRSKNLVNVYSGIFTHTSPIACNQNVCSRRKIMHTMCLNFLTPACSFVMVENMKNQEFCHA